MEIKNKKGTKFKLRENEQLEERPCPKCKGQLITDYGPGISCTFCVDCGYDDYDYDL